MKDEYLFFWQGTKSSDSVGKSCLSRSYEVDFEVDNVVYNIEQYVTVQKAILFNNDDIREAALKETDIKEVRTLGRKINAIDSDIWDEHKLKVMFDGNYAKFTQNEALKLLLLSTGDKTLVYASPYDRVWGIGLADYSNMAKSESTWEGQNLLGYILMEVRKYIREDLGKDCGDLSFIYELSEERLSNPYITQQGRKALADETNMIVSAGRGFSDNGTCCVINNKVNTQFFSEEYIEDFDISSIEKCEPATIKVLDMNVHGCLINIFTFS